MTDRKYLCPWVFKSDEPDLMHPKVGEFHGSWNAVDGREDPSKIGGECIVTCFDIDDATHALIVAEPDIEEIHGQNANAIVRGKIPNARAIASIKDAEDFMRGRRGAKNPLFRGKGVIH